MRIPGRRTADRTAPDGRSVLRRMRAILEGVGDGVYVTDAGGTIGLWNRAAERLLGCSSRRAVGRECSAVLGLSEHDDLLDCSRGCALVQRFGHAAAADGVEVSRRRRDQRAQPLLVTVAEIDGDADDREFVHTVRDLTAVKQADEAKTMFLATASHELKTPLTVIIGFTELLRAGMLDVEQRDPALETIDTRARELSRIVDRLLLTGRIDAGRLRLELKATDLSDVLSERAQSLAAVTDHSIVHEIPEDLPPVLGDAGALATAIDHLLDNAIKYSPDGGEITLAARASGALVEIEVRDRGIGMEPDQAEHCFDRFWQAESTDVRRFGGTGIGLYIVSSLVGAMGGRVSVTSAPGRGSAFVIALQRARPGAQPPSAAPVPAAGGRRTMIEEFMRQIGVPAGGP